MPSVDSNEIHHGSTETDDFDQALTGIGPAAQVDQIYNEKTTQHADDAIDFGDEDELADEDLPDDEHHENDSKISIQNDEEEEEEEEDDVLKELQQEARQGVDEENIGMTIGLFDSTFSNNNVGLADLDFEHSNVLADNHDDEEMNISFQMAKNDSNQMGLIGEDDIELSDEDDENENENEEERTKLRNALKEKLRLEKIEKEKKNKEKLLKIYYPAFKRGRTLKMQSLFPITPVEYPSPEYQPITRPLLPTKIQFEIQPDTRKVFRMSLKQLQRNNRNDLTQNNLPGQRIIQITERDLQDTKPKVEKRKKEKETLQSYSADMILSNADWDDDLIINCGEKQMNIPPSKKLKVQDTKLDGWEDDEDEMLFEGVLNLDSLNLKLDMNDPKLLFLDEDKNSFKPERPANNAKIPTTEKMIELKFSISNDKEYDILKANHQTKVRSTIGNLSIDHAPPARRLQYPYFKVKSTEKEIRLLHRPRFTVRPNTVMVFSRPKTRKRKRDRGKEVHELFPTSSNLTLGDSAQFYMMEYSEETPYVLSKFGMGSKLMNYYRKMSEQDQTRPKLPFGETHVLGLQDRSPFWNFGWVDPGSIVPTLYNQMYRAPVFKHEALNTDFLLIRSSGGGSSQKFYMRPINNLFTVGQTLPVVEVPGPNSRKVNTITRNRLKQIVYRLLNASENKRIAVKEVTYHFPGQSDVQNRQKLKEFMEFERGTGGGDNNAGSWKLKGSEKLPTYEETRQMISPEDVALTESMQSGHQYLDDLDSFRKEKFYNNDAGSSTHKPNKREKDYTSDESLVLQLSPWNATRNFIQAARGKAMLVVNEEDGITFLKTSMKGGGSSKSTNANNNNPESAISTPKPIEKEDKKSSSSHSLATQQQKYEGKIKNVWRSQMQRLGSLKSSAKLPSFSDEDLQDDNKMRAANRAVDVDVSEEPRYLKITRMVRNSYGILERKVEVIRDPKVVELYVKKKQAQLLEDSSDLVSGTVLTNDDEENLKLKKKLQEQLAKLEKEQERKKKKSPGITAANIDSEGRLSGKGIGKGKSTSRRCATCGALGHIRTNKTCPLYYTIHNKSNPNYIPGTTPVLPPPTNGSLISGVSTASTTDTTNPITPSVAPNANIELQPQQPPPQ